MILLISILFLACDNGDSVKKLAYPATNSESSFYIHKPRSITNIPTNASVILEFSQAFNSATVNTQIFI